MRVADGEGRISRLSLFFHSGDSVLGVLMHTVTVQGWPYAQEKFESVAEVVAVITLESVGAIVNGELCAQSDVEAVTVR